MSSRAEQKQKLKAEREARERQEREAAARRGRMMRIGVAAAVVLVAAIVAIVALSGGDSKTENKVDSAKLDISPGPWGTGTEGVKDRVTAMGLPDPSETAFHIHGQLSVYVNGKKQTIPTNVGIDSADQFLASLHTHDTEGVVHMEAARKFPFKLGQFFNTWGVKFTNTQLGAYHPGNGLVLETYVNGKKVADPVNYVMESHDLIVVGFGEPGSFPKKSKHKFGPGE